MKNATDPTLIQLAKIRTDGGTQSRASIYQNVVDDYAESVKCGAKFPPVVLFYDGKDYWLADGFHRHAAYKKAGSAKIPADVRQGARRDAILYSVGANETHGIRRTNEDKRRAVLTLLNDAEWTKWSDAEIARRCLVSHPTVGVLRRSLVNFTSEKTYTTKHGTVATMNTAGIGKPAVTPFDPVQAKEIIAQAKIIAGNDIEAKRELYSDVALTPRTDDRLSSFSGDNEWYTPAKYIELARDVLGQIDLDPASNTFAQKTVKAKKFYSIETNGLDKKWSGTVWMNPPYSNPDIQQFSEKLIEAYESKTVSAAIVLTNNSGDTAWHHSLANTSTARCITVGRIRFESQTRESNSPAMGQSFFYFGKKVATFAKVFGIVGRIEVNYA